jgi:hypothetical protein
MIQKSGRKSILKIPVSGMPERHTDRRNHPIGLDLKKEDKKGKIVRTDEIL